MDKRLRQRRLAAAIAAGVAEGLEDGLRQLGVHGRVDSLGSDLQSGLERILRTDTEAISPLAARETADAVEAVVISYLERSGFDTRPTGRKAPPWSGRGAEQLRLDFPLGWALARGVSRGLGAAISPTRGYPADLRVERRLMAEFAYLLSTTEVWENDLLLRDLVTSEVSLAVEEEVLSYLGDQHSNYTASAQSVGYRVSSPEETLDLQNSARVRSAFGSVLGVFFGTTRLKQPFTALVAAREWSSARSIFAVFFGTHPGVPPSL